MPIAAGLSLRAYNIIVLAHEDTHTHNIYRPCDLSFLITFAAVGRNNITILYIYTYYTI